MDSLEEKQRKAVVDEALSWLGTPYHHQGFIKGAGVDCGFLLIKAFHECGLIPWIDPRPYPKDWHLHRSAEKYLGWVEQYTKRLPDGTIPKPGDIILYRWGRCVSHGALVVDYPKVIHAYLGQGVLLADATQEPLTSRVVGVYSYWG
jgi:cell wall-associated NlpC family hydrolase